jgi:membrane protein insertase Oxa1/YidC/SpoIIIJ
MVLIMGFTMFWQQQTTPSPTMDPVQRKVFMMMPVIFTVMFLVFPMPAGLVLYWLVSNIISIIQQAYLRNDSGASPATATAVASVIIFAVGFVLTLI